MSMIVSDVLKSIVDKKFSATQVLKMTCYSINLQFDKKIREYKNAGFLIKDIHCNRGFKTIMDEVREKTGNQNEIHCKKGT